MTTNARTSLWALAIIGLNASIYWAAPPLRAQARAPQSQGAQAQPVPQPAGESRAMAHMPGMGSDADGAHPWCEDTEWSTFNHRVAGCFLLF